MKHISDKDWDLFKREATKLGIEIIKKADIPKGQEDNYVDLSDINIFDVICMPYDYSEISKFDTFVAMKVQAA